MLNVLCLSKIRVISYWISIVLLISDFCVGCITDLGTAGKTYYISPSGNDNNSGSIKKPWKSINRINRTNLKPGDRILLEGGKTFDGTVRLDSLDRGLTYKKIAITSFGNGKAIIDGGNSEGIIISDCDQFVIKNLIVKGNGRKNGNMTDGVFISSSGNFEVDSLDIFGFQHSGVHIRDSKNARIIHTITHDNGYAGIHVTGKNENDPVTYGNENLYIGYCKAFNNPGDPTILKNHSGNGILASSIRIGVIEYCEAWNNGWDMPWTGNGPVGIWIWDCTDFTIQYCISHDNKTNPVAADGGGFDFDGGVSNSVLQYCISYNNQGAGIGLFEFGAAKTWQNNIVRYNISQNDGILNAGSLAVWKGENGGTMLNCEIYNNTFYNDTAKGIALWVTNSMLRFSFRNNIFIYSGRYLGKGQKLDSEVFVNNCFWNLSGMNSAKLAKIHNKKHVIFFTDPCLKNPGSLKLTDPTIINAKTLSGYSLKPESSLIDKGVNQEQFIKTGTTKTDIAGTSLPQGRSVDIGALEYNKEH